MRRSRSFSARRWILALGAVIAAAAATAQITDIATVREDLVGDGIPDHMGETFIIEGRINSPFYTPTRLDFFVQDDTGGININTTPGEWTVPAGLDIGVGVEISGVVTQYNGKAELDPVFLPDNIVITDSTPVEPTPITLTIAQILADPETYEGRLVRVADATLTGDLPCAGYSRNLTLGDGTGTITFRVDGDTDIGGEPSYDAAVDVVAVVSQYDTSEPPLDSGYQLFPRMYTDLTQVGADNNAPRIDCFDPYPLIVDAGSTGTVVAVALDADSLDVVTLVANNLPDNAAFVDHGDRTGTITFTPELAQAGQTYTVSVVADDGLDSGSSDIDLQVKAVDSPYQGAIVLNEFMADPTGFDSNGDGVFDTSQDEYVELVFVDTGSLDIGGFTIHDGYGERHVMPGGTSLNQDQAIVVFGGGTPTGGFGGSVVQTASTGMLGLNNGGDTITVLDTEGKLVATVDYGAEAGFDQSLTLDPDVTGASYVQHTTATGSGGVAGSPGTRIDGASFSSNKPPTIVSIGDQAVKVGVTLQIDVTASDPDGDPITFPDPTRPANTTFVDNGDGTATFTFSPDVTQADQVFTVVFRAEDKDGFDEEPVDIDVLAADAYEALVMNEILYDPHPDGPPSEPNGDSNGDGVREGSQDEFIEIVNTGDKPINISGVLIRDAIAIRHAFGSGSKLAAGQAIVVFGGGVPVGDFGGSVVQIASTGYLGLNNSGDTVTLLEPDDATQIAQVVYDGSINDQSITLDPDLTGPAFVGHTTATGSGGEVHSPGTAIDGTPFGAAAPASEIVAIEALSATSLRITWTSASGGLYDVEKESGAGVGDWTAAASGVAAGAGDTTSAEVDVTGLGQAFYRVGRTN